MPSPSLVPGDGVERRTWMPAYAITFQAITSLFLGLRLVSRLTKQSTKWGWDDVFIILAFAFGGGLTALVLLSTYTAGFDRHIWDVPWTEWARGGLFGRLIEVLFIPASCFNKVSVLLFYQRVVEGTCSRYYKVSVWVALIFCVLYSIVFEFLLFTICRPVEAIWMRYDPTYTANYHCVSPFTETWTTQLAGALSVFSDFYALLLPGFLLMQLNIPMRQKVGLYCIFGLGFSVVAAGIVRTIYLGRVFSGKSTDITCKCNHF
ncbi:hypothetical protein NA57DRAFT_76856 [Rhizodiscina lignyota]|uniref:Rhodopsin domain-containing protein n=1 Tax=Rhizodiscina lignyota TaxID=1504668 RepID=A0A9P4IFB3_9PEZI|nr:hypothetical protein NA57DRAFT_76856 [Rhizodiscina lignyota]